MSSLCPGEYPTIIDIDIFYSNGSFVASLDNIPLNQLSANILTTGVAITLPDDQSYIATVTFSNMFDDFNITSNFSKTSYSIICTLKYEQIVLLILRILIDSKLLIIIISLQEHLLYNPLYLLILLVLLL